MPFVDVNGENIHYAHYDAGSDVNLVLVHGSGGCHLNWPVEALEKFNANVYAVDLPGHGESSGVGRDDVDEYVAIMDGFCNALSLGNVALAGHSLGGAIVLGSALSKKKWLTRLILVGTGSKLRVLPMIFDAIEQDYKGAVDMIGVTVYGPDVSPVLVEQEKQRSLSQSPKILLDDFKACDKFDVSSRLSEIDLPTLVISGDADKLTPVKYGQFLTDNIAGAQLVIIKDAGHLMAVEKPEEFVQAVAGFLS